jgi:glycosyltransferase involved in cell wall biosynthesis
MPQILALRPTAKLVCVGSDPPPPHAFPNLGGAIAVRGFVADVRAVFHEYSVFVCPILSGSGVRVKLLEAFASGIACVSTPIGAEGLAANDGEFCRLAGDSRAFAHAVAGLLDRPDSAMTARARQEVAQNWNMPAMTERLVERYRELLRAKRV